MVPKIHSDAVRWTAPWVLTGANVIVLVLAIVALGSRPAMTPTSTTSQERQPTGVPAMIAQPQPAATPVARLPERFRFRLRHESVVEMRSDQWSREWEHGTDQVPAEHRTTFTATGIALDDRVAAEGRYRMEAFAHAEEGEIALRSIGDDAYVRRLPDGPWLELPFGDGLRFGGFALGTLPWAMWQQHPDHGGTETVDGMVMRRWEWEHGGRRLVILAGENDGLIRRIEDHHESSHGDAHRTRHAVTIDLWDIGVEEEIDRPQAPVPWEQAAPQDRPPFSFSFTMTHQTAQEPR